MTAFIKARTAEGVVRDNLLLYIDPTDSNCLESDDVTVRNIAQRVVRLPPVGMTANTTAVSGTDFDGSYIATTDWYGSPFQIFNHLPTSGVWQSQTNSHNGATGQYILSRSLTDSQGVVYNGEHFTLQMPAAARLKSYTVIPRQDYGTAWRSPRKWWIFGSNDGTTWTLVDSQNGILGWTTVGKTFFVSPSVTTKFTRYRMLINEVGSVYSGGTDQIVAQVAELILHCDLPGAATLQGGAVLKDGCFQLTGSGQYISTTVTPNITSNRLYTYECWVWAPAAGIVGAGTEVTLLGNVPATLTAAHARIGVTSAGNVFFTERNSANTAASIYTTVYITDARWHHIAVTADSTTLTLYVDGVVAGTATRPGGTVTSGAMSIGGKTDENYLSQCRLGPVRVYTGAVLTAAQIRSNLSSDSGRLKIYVQPQITRNGNLILHYDFSDSRCYPGSGTTVTDLSGKGNHMTLHAEFSVANGVLAGAATTGRHSYTTTSYEFGGNNVTCIESWFLMRATSGFNWWSVLGWNAADGGGQGQTFVNHSAAYYGQTRIGASVYNTGSIAAGSPWVHFVWIYDSDGQQYVYVNGEFVTQRNRHAVDVITAPILFSNWSRTTLLRTCRVYHNYRLTAAEIRQNYLAEVDKFRPMNQISNYIPENVIDVGKPTAYFTNSGTLATFNTSMRRIEFSTTTFLQMPTKTYNFSTGVTICMKVGFDGAPSLGTNYFLNFQETQGSNLQRLSIGLFENKLQATITDSLGNVQTATGVRVITSGETFTLAVRLDPNTSGGAVTVWYNGVVDATLTGQAAMFTNASRTFNTLNTDINGANGSAWYLYRCSIFERVLTDLEIGRYSQLLGEGLGSATASQPSLRIRPEVRACYPGSGRFLFDLSGWDHHCTLKSHAAVVGDFIRLAPTSYVDCPLLPQLGSTDQGVTARVFTAEAWFRTSNADEIGILTDGTETVRYSLLYFSGADGKLKSMATDGTTTHLVQSPSSVLDGNWHHAAAVYRTNVIELWLDGSMVASTARTLKTDALSPLRIGHRFASNTSSMDVGAVSLWLDRAFNRMDVRNSYFSSLLSYTDFRGTILHIDPMKSASYPGSGTTLFDLSGAGNHCALMNGATVSNGTVLLEGGTQFVESVLQPSFGGAYALECWYCSNSSGVTAGDCSIFSNGSEVTIQARKDGRAGFKDRAATTTSTGSIETGRWHHLVLTNTGTYARFYIDGVLQASSASTATALATPTPLKIGGGLASVFQNCRIGPVRLYTGRALQPDRILRNFWMDRDRIGTGVLDTLTSPARSALQAAFALTLLSRKHAGPVIKVRRTSDDVSMDFYADPSGALTTEPFGLGTTLTAWLNGSTGAVSTWYDQSGNDRHATQSDVAYQPLVNLSDATVNFRADLSHLTLPDSTVPANDSPYSIIARLGGCETATKSYVLYSGAGSSANYVLLNPNSVSFMDLQNGWRAPGESYVDAKGNYSPIPVTGSSGANITATEDGPAPGIGSVFFNNATGTYLNLTSGPAESIRRFNTIDLVTFEAWVKLPAPYTGTYPNLVANASTSPGCNWGFGFQGMKLRMYLYQGTGAVSTNSIPVNTWTHVAMSYVKATSQATIFINGVADGVGTISSSIDYGSIFALAIGIAQNQVPTVHVANLMITTNKAYTSPFTPSTNLDIQAGTVFALSVPLTVPRPHRLSRRHTPGNAFSFVYDGTNITSYVDSVIVGTTTPGAARTGGSANNLIGASKPSGVIADSLRAELAYLFIFNTALGATDRKLLEIRSKFVFDRLTSAARASAKALYSLRHVSFTYTGPIARLRRLSDNAELDFYSDPSGNVTATVNGEVVAWSTWAPGGASITTWYDQTGQGRHATQTVQTAQPLMKSGAQFLDMASATLTNSGLNVPQGTVYPLGGNPFTIVTRFGKLVNGTLYHSGPTTSGNAIGLSLNNGSYNSYFWSNDLTTATGLYTENSVISCSHAGGTNGTHNVFINSVLISTRSVTRNTTTSSLCFIGKGGTGLAGKPEIYNMFVFESVLSDADRLILETAGYS